MKRPCNVITLCLHQALPFVNTLCEKRSKKNHDRLPKAPASRSGEQQQTGLSASLWMTAGQEAAASGSVDSFVNHWKSTNGLSMRCRSPKKHQASRSSHGPRPLQCSSWVLDLPLDPSTIGEGANCDTRRRVCSPNSCGNWALELFCSIGPFVACWAALTLALSHRMGEG